ncbi:porin [Carboxylicivirga sediminis]|uniref:Porin n=1 Tax=Carboxylicivirga sediminis TaxID=2006564 RepID=A0A941IY30_9BACT|nr:porin [Carboxylicivirga sediminis]MBR8537466.1 porin [Carboxylicivirga sediminis]
MTKNIILLILASCLLLPANLLAQGCEEAAGSDEALKIFGFLQAEYDQQFTDETTSSFSFRRARLGATGNIPYDFSYYVVMEMSPMLSSNGSAYLLDAFITYGRWDWAKISMGSFKNPFSMDLGGTACSGINTIFRSRAVDQLVVPQRDLGIMVLGGDRSTFFQYRLAYMNGAGLKKDNNNSKDIIARAVFHPLDFLYVGGSYRLGYPTNDDDKRTSYALEAEFNYGPFRAMGEYIVDEGEYDRSLGGGCGGELIALGDERKGAYVQAMYMTKWNVEPVFKYEFFDAGVNDYREDIMTFGANYFFNDWTRLQVNYLYRAEEPVEGNNDGLYVQLQVKF